MSFNSKIRAWRSAGQFCSTRISDYGALFLVEFAQVKASALRELVSMVVLAVGLLFALAFVCFAIIATAWRSPYFVVSVWSVAGFWLVVSLISFVIIRKQRPMQPFHVIGAELQRDIAALKEVLR